MILSQKILFTSWMNFGLHFHKENSKVLDGLNSIVEEFNIAFMILIPLKLMLVVLKRKIWLSKLSNISIPTIILVSLNFL